MAPPPLGYVFDLPIAPQGTLLDVDNNGQEDTGVQIFSIMMGANINGGSHLEQLDQAGDVASYLSDPKLLALGYALEQQLQGRVEPDLDAVVSTFP